MQIKIVMSNSLFKIRLCIVLNFNNRLSIPQRHRKDVSNFDKQFTSEKTELTPTDKLFMMNLDQTEFSGFSYLNPEYIQHV